MRDKIVKVLLVFIPTIVILVWYFALLFNSDLFNNLEKDVPHDTYEYYLDLFANDEVNDGEYRILQLTDIHLANKDDRSRQYAFLTKTIEAANPEFIAITGDSFTFADMDIAIEYFDFLDSFGIPWTLVFGNHDEQCYFSIDWLTSYLNDLTESGESHCLFKDIQNDDVFGNSNFAVRIIANNAIFENLIFMDSNRYNYSLEYIGYDYVKDSQIEWYKKVANANGAESLLFMHIPLPEWNDIWEMYENGDSKVTKLVGDKGEKSCIPKYNSGLFDVILEVGMTKAISCGHDHLNDFTLKYQYGSLENEYVCISYGVDSTDRIYFDEEMLGGKLIKIDSNTHELSFENIIIPYSEYEGGSK